MYLASGLIYLGPKNILVLFSIIGKIYFALQSVFKTLITRNVDALLNPTVIIPTMKDAPEADVSSRVGSKPAFSLLRQKGP